MDTTCACEWCVNRVDCIIPRLLDLVEEISVVPTFDTMTTDAMLLDEIHVCLKEDSSSSYKVYCT